MHEDQGQDFLKKLEENNIAYDKVEYRLQGVTATIAQLMAKEQKDSPFYNMEGTIYTIPLSDYQRRNPNTTIAGNDVILTNYGGYMAECCNNGHWFFFCDEWTELYLPTLICSVSTRIRDGAALERYCA
ncbi:hypothetical protein LSPH24S_09039 [Lysinibacillus sphaericus]